jgi:hypothetical protein
MVEQATVLLRAYVVGARKNIACALPLLVGLRTAMEAIVLSVGSPSSSLLLTTMSTSIMPSFLDACEKQQC